MIRVAHISGARSWRGAEKQIGLLLRGNVSGIENFLFCPFGSALHRAEISGDDHTDTYNKRFGFDIAGAWKLKGFVKQKKINLLHIHDSHALNLYWAARFMGLDCPVVLTRHVRFKPGNPYKYRGDCIRAVICVSEAVRAVMSEISGQEKCRVIHPGIENTRMERKNGFRQSLALQKEDVLVGTVAALEKEKDIPAFLRIAQKVHGHFPKTHFVIIGEGSLRSQIENEISRSGSSGYIRLTGFRDDVPEIIPDLDMFLFTSSSEGFPLAPAEAMQGGVPVVARDTSGLNELLTDGVNGRLYNDEAEAVKIITDLLKDQGARQEMIKKGLERSEQFSVERLIEKTHNLYREILP